MPNWKEYKLGEIAEIVMGQSPAGETCNEDGEGMPLLNGPTEFGSSFPHPVQFTTDPRKFAKPFDILFCVRGSTTGRMNWADRDYAIGRGLAAIRHREGEQYRHFIKGLIDANLSLLLQSATGSTFPNVSKDQINNISVLAPDLSTQESISEILSSLDDKIELNNQINKELEALAQALFKHWFIDFDFPNENGQPYKSSGGEMIESELGEIPKGWNVLDLGSTSNLFAGGDKPKIVSQIPTEQYHVPIYSNGISEEGLYGYTDIAKIYDESITVSARGTIGFVCLRTQPYVPIVRLIAVIPNPKILTCKYLYMWLKNQNIEGNGTTQQQLTVPDFKTMPVLVPQIELTNLFAEIMNSLHENILSNKSENIELANLRDTLLPKLISGELEVTEALTEKVM